MFLAADESLTASGPPPPPSPLDHEAIMDALRRVKEQREPDPRALGLTLLVCSVLCCAAICASYIMLIARAEKERIHRRLQAELDSKTEHAEGAEWMMGAGGEHARRKLTRTAGGFFRALI